jgi:hypothetical protein
MRAFKKSIATAALVAGLAFTSAASAQVIRGELLADAGTYSPIALGESVLLDGCGSVFDDNRDANVTGNTVSLCNGVTDLTPFDFTWTVYDTDYNDLGYVYGVTPTMTTGGLGDIITAAGTYFLSLNVTLSPTSSTFALPGGQTGGFAPYPGNLAPNSSSAFSGVALIVTPASVPEPAAALLLLPAMVIMARRQRKQRKQTAA